MRLSFLVSLLFLPLLTPGVALAQRIFMPRGAGDRWGDRFVVLSELPPECHQELKEALNCVPKLAWRYWQHHYDMWHSGGCFVLLDEAQDHYWIFPREVLVELLGPGGEAKLIVPWIYWCPTGIILVLLIIGFICFLVMRGKLASRRLNEWLNDEQYQDAVQTYLNALTAESKPTKAVHREAFRTAATLLTKTGISEYQARKRLHQVLISQTKAFTGALSNSAHAHAEEGNWEEAQAQFHDAATIMQFWDNKMTEYFRDQEAYCLMKLTI